MNKTLLAFVALLTVTALAGCALPGSLSPAPDTPTPARTVIRPATPSPTVQAVNPHVEISASTKTLKVDGTVTITGQAVDIGLPYYILYLDDQAIARVTYNGEVRSEGGTNAVLEFVSAEGAMKQAQFVLRAQAAGVVQARITATGEIHYPQGAMWAGGGSESLQIIVTSP